MYSKTLYKNKEVYNYEKILLFIVIISFCFGLNINVQAEEQKFRRDVYETETYIILHKNWNAFDINHRNFFNHFLCFRKKTLYFRKETKKKMKS